MINKLTAIFPLQYSISSINESALLVSFENRIDEYVNEVVIALNNTFFQQQFIGFIETVPAYSSLAVYYDIMAIRSNYNIHTTVYDFVKGITEQLLSNLEEIPSTAITAPIQVPVYYNGEDLGSVANLHNLSVEEVIKIHTGKLVRVYMIGFLPGFAYMGKVDDRIATPRRSSPRPFVKPGSVGIAGPQTGIYPLASPGGWQLIGQTPRKIFDVTKERPCLFEAGDIIRFFSISKPEFDKLNEY